MSRIFYECRDIDVPSGGIRRLYRHVEILNKNGFKAYILHYMPGFRPAWFESNAPTVYWNEKLKFDRNDVLVIPEGHTDVIIRTTGAEYKRVVIALSWSYIYAKLPIGKDWRDYGICQVIAGSRYVHEFILRSMGLDGTVIVSGIDLSMFRPAGDKKCQIAYMPRKNENWYHMIASVFRAKYPEFCDVPFIPINNVSHREVSRILAESAVFLATGFPEGLARPPLEAMACGCLVVGFAGRGSLEYMEHGVNCMRAEDMDVLTAAEHLGAAIRRFRSGEASAMQGSARETASRYSLEMEEKNVVGYWTSFLKAGAMQAMQPHGW